MKTKSAPPSVLPAAFRLALGLALLLAIAGCASVEHKLVTSDKTDETDKGIRYYPSAPYVLIYADGKGGIAWKIYYLPDQTRKMSASPNGMLSKVASNMAFADGVLTEATSEGDGTAVAKAVISAVEKVALAALTGAANAPGDNTHRIPAPHLYRIVIKNGTVELKGAQAPGDIQTSILSGGKS